MQVPNDIIKDVGLLIFLFQFLAWALPSYSLPSW